MLEYRYNRSYIVAYNCLPSHATESFELCSGLISLTRSDIKTISNFFCCTAPAPAAVFGADLILQAIFSHSMPAVHAILLTLIAWYGGAFIAQSVFIFTTTNSTTTIASTITTSTTAISSTTTAPPAPLQVAAPAVAPPPQPYR